MKPPTVNLHRNESPLAGLRRGTTMLVDFVLEKVREGELTPGGEVHLIRVTAKQLRGYLQVLRPAVVDQDYRREDRFLSGIAGNLAGSRDRAVMKRTFAHVESETKKGRKALRKARSTLCADDHATVAVSSATEIRQAVGSLRDARERINRLQPHAKGWKVIQQGVYHTYRRARRHRLLWEKSSDLDEAHKCRRYTKYLCFQLDLLEGIDAKWFRLVRRRLGRLEARLGRLNDLVTLERRLKQAARDGELSKSTAKGALKAVNRSRKRLASECRKRAAKALRPHEDEFMARLEKGWRRWNTG